MTEEPKDETVRAVEEALAKENPKDNKCIWCGDWHAGLCPRIKCIEFDPVTGRVFRYYFYDVKKGE